MRIVGRDDGVEDVSDIFWPLVYRVRCLLQGGRCYPVGQELGIWGFVIVGDDELEITEVIPYNVKRLSKDSAIGNNNEYWLVAGAAISVETLVRGEQQCCDCLAEACPIDKVTANVYD